MLKIQELKELIRALDQSSVDELIYEQAGTKIKLIKQQMISSPIDRELESNKVLSSIPSAKASEQEPVETTTPVIQKLDKQEVANDAYTIKSPMVGTFYTAASPEKDPYVSKGDQVKEHSIVCIVEAMKLMNEIEAEIEGTIVEVLAENGELVEYGQPLFVVELN